MNDDFSTRKFTCSKCTSVHKDELIENENDYSSRSASHAVLSFVLVSGYFQAVWPAVRNACLCDCIDDAGMPHSSVSIVTILCVACE